MLRSQVNVVILFLSLGMLLDHQFTGFYLHGQDHVQLNASSTRMLDLDHLNAYKTQDLERENLTVMNKELKCCSDS